MKSRNVDETRVKGDGGPDRTEDVREELGGLKARLDELSSELSNVPAATELQGLKANIEALSATVGDIPGKYDAVIKALEDRLDEIQTATTLAGASKAKTAPEGVKAIVEAISDSDVYKAIVEAGAPAASISGGFSHPVKIPSLAAQRVKAADPVTISDMAGGNLTAYRPGLISPAEWAMDLYSRIPSVVVQGATTYAVPQVTDASRYGAWTSTLAADLDGDPTPKTTATFADVDGLMVGSYVRFYDSSGDYLGQAAVVSINTSTKVVTFGSNALTWDASTGDRVVSENYAVTAEEATKPSGWVGTQNVTFALKTLATLIPTTVNAINTISGLSAMIEQKLPRQWQRNLSRHLLYGDDGSGQLQGLRSYADAQSYSWSDGTTGDNQLDAVMRAANLVPWNGALAIIMSQVDLVDLQALKDSNGNYLQSNSFGLMALTNMGGRWFLGPYELIFDYAVASGDFTVINLADASEIADANVASLMWGYIDDDFAKNIIRARYEGTLCHAIKDVTAYVVGEWDAAP